MSDPNPTGSSYLSALKNAHTPQAAAPAPARSAHPSEKRRSPRYSCQGSAHLRELATGVATWATFTDISLHGIYVEAMATFRQGCELSLTLEVNGYRVESTGDVRVMYPGLGMGISFLNMSDEHRERLRELLRSLSQPSVILNSPDREAAQYASSNPNSQFSDAQATMSAIVQFFETRHILSRDEFLRILKKSQTPIS